MGQVKKSIEVKVPIHEVYNQWTQFESFPQFMEGVEQVQQLDDKRLHWKAKIGGKEKEWDAIIATQEPDRSIAWHNTSGAQNAGRVSFEHAGTDSTRVTLEMSFDPEGVLENVGDALGVPERQVEGDLKRFKEFIERSGTATGAWRGEIKSSQVQSGS